MAVAAFHSKIYVGGPSLFKGDEAERRNTVDGRIDANNLNGNILPIYPNVLKKN